VLVNAGILILDERNNIPRGKFSVPYINGKYIVPVLVVAIFVGWYALSPDGFTDFFTKGNNWNELKHKLPFWLFMFLAIYTAIRCVCKKLLADTRIGLAKLLLLNDRVRLD
jgi:APA family basic amino acid/polyamine antiporter